MTKPSLTDAIKVLEDNGYCVFPASRVRERWFEQRAESYLWHTQPDFREYFTKSLRRMMASNLAHAIEQDLIWTQYPEDVNTGSILFRSRVALVVPTQEALDRERDDHLVFLKEQEAEAALKKEEDQIHTATRFLRSKGVPVG